MDKDKLYAQLIRHEGLKLTPYTDTVGKLTIGVGHNLTDLGITKDQALYILEGDLTSTMDFISRSFPWFNSLDEVRQRAIVDMTFDLMGGMLEFKHMLAAITSGDWDAASDHLLASKFATQTGVRARDLAYMLKTGLDPR